MKIGNREAFIAEFKDEFEDQIETFTEGDLNGFKQSSYYIELKQGVNSNHFFNLTLPFVNRNSDFEESFELWIREKGQDLATSILLTINGDYSDSDRDNWEVDEDDEDIDPIHIQVDGRSLQVFDVGSYGQFLVMENDEILLDIYLSASEGTNHWTSRDNFDQLFIDKIGEAIENSEI